MKQTISKSQKVNKKHPPKRKVSIMHFWYQQTTKKHVHSLRKGPGFRPQVTAPQQKSGPKSCPLWSNSMAPPLQVAGSPYPPGEAHSWGLQRWHEGNLRRFHNPPVELQLPRLFLFVSVLFFFNWKSKLSEVVPEFGNIKTVQHKNFIRFRFKQKIFSEKRPGPKILSK